MLAEACVYGGQDKSKKSELIQDLMRTYRKRPKLNNDALRGNPRLLNIFTPVVQEVSLKVEEVRTIEITTSEAFSVLVHKLSASFSSIWQLHMKTYRLHL